MRTEYIFPTVLIALDVCAAMPYAWHGNLRMMVYWLAAATPNPRVEATVVRSGGLAADCADHALLTRCRPVLARLSRFLRGRKGNDMTDKERLRRGWSAERALGVCDE